MPKYTQTNNPFTIQHPNIEDRQKESANIMARYPDRRPIVIYTDDKSFDVPKKTKFLVPEDQTIGLFIAVLRKSLNLTSEKALWTYVNDSTLLSSSHTISSVYEEYAGEDGFLYIKYVGENTFGGC